MKTCKKRVLIKLLSLIFTMSIVSFCRTEFPPSVADAKRIATKYVNIVNDIFIKTNNLWEKYNIADGSTNTTNEYGLPPIMDWTAGVFVYASDLLYK